VGLPREYAPDNSDPAAYLALFQQITEMLEEE
jgi:hypothetical protein